MRYIAGDGERFASLAAALDYARDVQNRTGVILSVEEQHKQRGATRDQLDARRERHKLDLRPEITRIIEAANKRVGRVEFVKYHQGPESKFTPDSESPSGAWCKDCGTLNACAACSFPVGLLFQTAAELALDSLTERGYILSPNVKSDVVGGTFAAAVCHCWREMFGLDIDSFMVPSMSYDDLDIIIDGREDERRSAVDWMKPAQQIILDDMDSDSDDHVPDYAGIADEAMSDAKAEAIARLDIRSDELREAQLALVRVEELLRSARLDLSREARDLDAAYRALDDERNDSRDADEGDEHSFPDDASNECACGAPYRACDGCYDCE